MFSTALLPVSFRESMSRIHAMLTFLHNFDTERVVFLHVSSGPVTAGTERKLQAFRDQAARDLAETRAAAGAEATQMQELVLDARVHSGSPAFEIAVTAREEGADFIYFPWKRKSWIQQTLIGSTTRDVIRLSNLPIFVSKQRGVKSPEEPFRVLYPTNFQSTDRYVIPYLRYPGLAADDLILLNAHDRAPDPTAESRQKQWCTENLSRLTEEVKDNFTEVEPVSMTGSPRRVVPRMVRRNSVDLVILGKSDQESALTAMMGSVAEEIAKSTPCSVFVVSRAYQPPAESAAPETTGTGEDRDHGEGGAE